MRKIGIVVVLVSMLLVLTVTPGAAVEPQKVTGANPVAYIKYVNSEKPDFCVNCTIEVGFEIYHNAQVTNYPISFTLTLPLYLESQGLRYLGHIETAGFRNLKWSNWGENFIVKGEIYQDTGVGHDTIYVSYQPVTPQGAWRATFSYVDDLGNPYTKIMTIIVGGPDILLPHLTFFPQVLNADVDDEYPQH